MKKSLQKKIKRVIRSKRFNLIRQKGAGKTELMDRIISLEREIHQAEEFQLYNPGAPFFEFTELRKQQNELKERFNKEYPESKSELSEALMSIHTWAQITQSKKQEDLDKMEREKQTAAAATRLHAERSRETRSWVDQQLDQEIEGYIRYIQPMLLDENLLSDELKRLNRVFGEYCDAGCAGGLEAKSHKIKQKILYDAIESSKK